ncbi:MAG: CPBP family intramembrane glutamic endopeptidase [Parvularculaceae bacterium]|nr:CPBP family intramembrane metalloprotease [Parvularculaceae bacterium]
MKPSPSHPAISRPLIIYSPEKPDLGLATKFLAILEILAVVAASTAAAFLAQKLVSPGLGETLGLSSASAPDYLASSLAIGKQFALQYGAAIALILLLGALRRRTAPRHYALGASPLGAPRLVALGVITGLIASIPAQSIFLAKEFWPLGKDTLLWTVMESNPWDWTFWVFAATASFVLVPIVEELMWRSYVLGRLVEAFRPGAALLLSSLVFAGLHFQYLVSGDFLGYATMASVLFAALVFGLVTLTSGSVLPAVIAHMILNIPMNMEFGAARLALGLLTLAIFAVPVARYAKLLGKAVFQPDTLVMACCIAALAGAGYAIAAQQPPLALVGAGAGAVILAGAVFMNSPWRARGGKAGSSDAPSA